MKIRPSWTVGVLLPLLARGLSAAVAPVDHAPKLALIECAPGYLLDSDPALSRAEAREAATYDLIASAVSPKDVLPIRALNPKQIDLFPMSFGGVPHWDGFDKAGFRMPHWELPDTAWSPLAKMEYALCRNLEMGCDWIYRSVDGAPILEWNVICTNFSRHCPVGRWGATRGLTASQYWLVCLLECARNPTFRSAFDGYWLDTYPGGYRDPKSFAHLDLDHDGLPDPMPTAEEAAQMQVLLAGLEKGLLPKQILILGQDQLDPKICPAGRMVNGWKLEDCPWQPGSSRWLLDWWTGGRRTSGYWHAQQALHRYETSSENSPFQGWGMTVVEAMKHPSVPQTVNPAYGRFVLAFTLMGDGYFALETFGTQKLSTRIPEMDSWKFAPAREPMYWAPDPKHKGASWMCRTYTRLPSRETCTVWVDTTERDGGVLPGKYPR